MRLSCSELGSSSMSWAVLHCAHSAAFLRSFPFHARGELRLGAPNYFYSEDRVLRHFGDSEFEHGFGRNPDLLWRAPDRPERRINLLSKILCYLVDSRSRQDSILLQLVVL